MFDVPWSELAEAGVCFVHEITARGISDGVPGLAHEQDDGHVVGIQLQKGNSGYWFRVPNI